MLEYAFGVYKNHPLKKFLSLIYEQSQEGQPFEEDKLYETYLLNNLTIHTFVKKSDDPFSAKRKELAING